MKKNIILSKKQKRLLYNVLAEFESLKRENISIVFDRDLSKFYAYSNINVKEVFTKDEECSNRQNEMVKIKLDREDYNIQDLGFLVKLK